MQFCNNQTNHVCLLSSHKMVHIHYNQFTVHKTDNSFLGFLLYELKNMSPCRTLIFSHHYGCSTSQEIPHLLENLKGDDNYKRLYTKMWTQYSLYHYSNKPVCVICCTLRCTEEPSTHSSHGPNKTTQSSHPVSFKQWHYIILLSLQSGSSCSGFLN
jgi:hypothetical protein